MRGGGEKSQPGKSVKKCRIRRRLPVAYMRLKKLLPQLLGFPLQKPTKTVYTTLKKGMLMSNYESIHFVLDFLTTVVDGGRQKTYFEAFSGQDTKPPGRTGASAPAGEPRTAGCVRTELGKMLTFNL